MSVRLLLAIGGVSAMLTVTPTGDQAAAGEAPSPYLVLAQSGGARSVEIVPRADGGFLVNGTLDGRQFAIAIPKVWNHEALLFAHGYTMPGSSVAVSTDPVDKDPGLGLLKTAYDQGFAVGHSAYDKAGVGVESGAKATLRLDALIARMGSTRTYVSGGSMGGSIVMALIEQHPGSFAGALSVCGVTAGWKQEIGGLIDLRATYNYLTRGTPYALPGAQDLSRSALPTLPPAGWTKPRESFQMGQIIKMASKVIKLFLDAKRAPDGPAAAIIRNVSSVTGVEPDPAAFVFPLVTVALGMDDMRATFGGNVYGNRGKTYASATLTADETAALNTHIQRIDADRAAVAYAGVWHETRGDYRTPLVAVHNQVDPLVPYSQAEALKVRTEKQHNSARLTLITVPPQRAEIPGSGVTGYVHCGFTTEQMANAWSVLRAHVEGKVSAGRHD